MICVACVRAIGALVVFDVPVLRVKLSPPRQEAYTLGRRAGKWLGSIVAEVEAPGLVLCVVRAVVVQRVRIFLWKTEHGGGKHPGCAFTCLCSK